MELFPLDQLPTISNALPMLVMSLNENGVTFHGIKTQNAVEFFVKQDVESLIAALPPLPTNNVFIMTLASVKNATSQILEINLSVQVTGDQGMVDYLDLELFRQNDFEPLSADKLVWNTLDSDLESMEFLDTFKSITEYLIRLFDITKPFQDAILEIVKESE